MFLGLVFFMLRRAKPAAAAAEALVDEAVLVGAAAPVLELMLPPDPVDEE